MAGRDYCEPLIFQFASDHHTSHEDAKPWDLTRELPIRCNAQRDLLQNTRSSDSVYDSSTISILPFIVLRARRKKARPVNGREVRGFD